MPFGALKQMEQNKQKIDRTSAWILFGLGVLVFVGGAVQLRGQLFAFERGLDKKFEEALAKSGIESTAAAVQDGISDSTEAEDLTNLQTTDSDQDGLTDFEELYVRGTSPYLQDTDSDGISDFTEIAENTNPNCPEGQDCLQERVGGDVITTDAEESLADLAGGSRDASVDLTPSANLSADEIRAFLLQSGVAQEEIDEIPDADLEAIYRQVYQQEAAGASTNSQVQSEVARLQAMNTDERREYLIQSGVSSTEINALTDDEINTLFEQGLEDTISELGVAAPTTETSTNTE